MGDKTTRVSQPGAPAEVHRQDAAAAAAAAAAPAPAYIPSYTTTEYPYALAASHPRQHEQHTGSQHDFMSQLDMTHQQRRAPFDMGSMANTLPPEHYRAQPYGHGPQRYNAAPVQMPTSQFGPPNTMGPMAAPQYYVPHHAHMAQYYQTPLSPQQPSTLPPRHDMSYYPSPMVMNQPPHAGAHFYYTPGAAFPGHPPHAQGQAALGQYGLPNMHHQHTDTRSRHHPQPSGQELNPASPSPQANGATENCQNMVRGPPRKPRQSGHAIWVGNLPPQTDLMSLVHHVCRETEGLESLFLISKSNCAFANFKDEQSCSAAQRKLHDSKFMTVRLVSRLRKSTVEGPAGVTAPTGPAASAPQAGAAQEASVSGGDGGETKENGVAAVTCTTPATAALEVKAAALAPLVDGPSLQRDRFFVLKSLTVEDLDLSVRTSIWATQSHNEETLNSAFKTSDNVYLIFSANKSGEYFGYARMVSAVNEDPAAAVEFAPSAQSAGDVDLPKAIATEPTEFAPKGRIIDDSARGTIFWEADRDDKAAGAGSDGGQDDEGSNGSGGGGDTGSVRSGQESSTSEPKAWGKPFRLEWLSTARLPFYRTRGLRNPWNSNREVKIARDGTELEPSVGRRLIGLFNRAQSPALGMPPPPMVPSMAAVGYPPMR
ncbi:zinc finger CCCH domain-containing protein 45 [Chaetomidium leptoderma]|uniref:Zinc finger CCCH domain-containing protein 45 n=1 Tax=Chaetomidium leptoderma TaxID=669021 RepID=A0AAN6ZYY9_9PEZI|nr:zinc finger CCCH domain-containing protein 45 [Chaetomidium leptoderma]